MFSGLFSKQQPASTSASRASARAANMEKRLESLRKEGSGSRDAEIRGSSGATSARDYLTKSLGRAPGPSHGTSLGRMTNSSGMSFGSGLSSMPPKLPPMRPLGK